MTPLRNITNQDTLKVRIVKPGSQLAPILKPVVCKPQDKDLLRARLQSRQVLSSLHAPGVLQSAAGAVQQPNRISTLVTTQDENNHCKQRQPQVINLTKVSTVISARPSTNHNSVTKQDVTLVFADKKTNHQNENVKGKTKIKATIEPKVIKLTEVSTSAPQTTNHKSVSKQDVTLDFAVKETNHQNENVKGKTKFLATIEKKSAEEHLSIECTKELGLNACVNDECNAEDSSDLSDEEFVRKPKIKPSAKVLQSLQHAQKRAATVELSKEEDEIPKKRKTPNCRLSVSEIEKLVIAAEDKSKSLMEDFKDITDTLPSLFDFIVISIERNINDPEEWKAVLRLNISSQEEAELWIEEFEMLTKSDFRQKETRLKDSPQVVFKRLMRCQYKVPKSNYQPKKNLLGKRPMKRESKNTDCGSNLIVTVKRKEMKWSSDIFLSKFPCDIKINFYHNHFILTKDSLKHRRPSAAVTAKFHLLFEQGHSPSSAVSSHKFDMQMEVGEDYFVNSADRSKCPDVKWAFREYYKIYKKCYGAPSGEEMLTSLEEFINKYNASQNEKCVAFQVLDGKDLMIAICTPLMKRVHTRLRSAGEVVFVDSRGTMDTHNTRVFLILCPSIAGALPLGVLMVSSEAEVVLKPAFELLLTLLPDEAFGGRGKKGPKIFMTDDCDQERNTLHSLFPEAVLLLCLFHVLNAYWRYVWKSEHHVKKDDRAPVYFSFRDVVYASDEETFEALWNDMMNLPSVKDNACLNDHLVKFKPRAAEWALHLRNDILTRGHHTNNYAEAGMRILKDKVCNRKKAFSPVQLLDFVLSRFNSYLERRIIDLINDRTVNYTRSRYFIEPEKLQPLMCSPLDRPHLYLVKNSVKGSEYVVNMLDEVCSCPVGKNGSPCKHLAAVAKNFDVPCSQILNCKDPKAKLDLLYIVYGESAKIPDHWFADLHSRKTDDHGGNTVVENREAEENFNAVEDTLDDDTSPNEALPIQPSHSPEMISDLSNSMRDMVEGWIRNLEARPGIFYKGCKSICKQNQTMCKSDSSLISAMVMFGKEHGSPSLTSSIEGVQNIPVQPLSKARRTAFLGGRNTQITGRPSAAMLQHVPEHNFSKQTASQRAAGTYAFTPSRLARAPAPHSMSTCVDRRVLVGHTHAKK